MKLLLIVPLPPPVTGHSLISQVLVDGLRDGHETAVVNLSVGSLNDGRITLRRVSEVGKVLLAVWRKKAWADRVYLTISESRAGNLKDLLIYAVCAGRLRQCVIHLHGGTIGRELFARHPWWRKVNAAFIKRLGGVVVSGPSHVEIFTDMIDPRRLHIVPNSAQDELFVSEDGVRRKFENPRPLRILYISALTPEKGYLDLLDAWDELTPASRARLHLDLAGRFDSDVERAACLERLAGLGSVTYHGRVDAEAKRRLFAEAHLFCLPTRMFEGQPISILEAYAAGCVVVTTGQPGIRDVFSDGVNGFEVAERSPASIARALEHALDDLERVRRMAVTNRRTAGERYRASIFTAALKRILAAGAPT